MLNKEVIYVHLSEVLQDIGGIMNDLASFELNKSMMDEDAAEKIAIDISIKLTHAAWRINELTHEYDKTPEELKKIPEEVITRWRREVRDPLEGLRD